MSFIGIAHPFCSFYLRIGELPENEPEFTESPELRPGDLARLEKLQARLASFRGKDCISVRMGISAAASKEFNPVLAGTRRDAPDRPLVVEMSCVVECRNGRHVDAPQGERPAFFQAGQGQRHQFTGGAKK